MPSSALYTRGKRAAKAGRPRTPPAAGKRAIADPIAREEWLRGYDAVMPPDSAGPPPGERPVVNSPQVPPGAGPVAPSDVPPAPPPGGVLPDTAPPPSPGDAADLRATLDAGGLPSGGGPDPGMVDAGGGTCYEHSMGSQRCVARLPDGTQCTKRVVRPMVRQAADRIGRRLLGLSSSAVAAIADVEDPGVEDAEAEGVGAGIYALSERAPWLNENVGGLALGGLTLISYPVRVAFHVRREKERLRQESLATVPPGAPDDSSSRKSSDG